MALQTLMPKNFSSDREISWCPGCGDYSILKQVQTILPQLNIPKENIVFVSGIGCSSRFPYYMNTYGIHGIHGRAPSIATGLKISRPDLDIWVITGDGDALSIGGNHLIHIFRRNVNVNILLFNNEIYGLTKGQFSPTSPLGLKTKTSPLGVIDQPFNPLALALGANASFVARSIDRNPSHLRETLLRCHSHQGTSFLEIYQNCNIFNDGAFQVFTDKSTQSDMAIFLENNKPLVFGKERTKGLILDGLSPKVVSLEEYSLDDLWIHDESNKIKASILTHLFDDPRKSGIPRPFGVFYSEVRECYENRILAQLKSSSANPMSLRDLLYGNHYWEVD